MRVHHLPEDREHLETIEVSLLLEGIYRLYGLDFREYAPASLTRRLWKRAQAEDVQTVSALQEKVMHDRAAMERLTRDLSINVTSMFRDPSFYSAFRAKVVPTLRTYPFLRIWNAGCSSGEETFSMAVLLEEEGLLERSRIYATDLNEGVLERARAGVIGLDRMAEYSSNHRNSGGTRSLADHCTIDGDSARLDPRLTRNIVFAQHNLVSDRSFNEFNVILCRNVMIYFGKPLQDHVHRLLYESLGRFGVLALGRKESIKFTPHEECFKVLEPAERLYRRLS